MKTTTSSTNFSDEQNHFREEHAEGPLHPGHRVIIHVVPDAGPPTVRLRLTMMNRLTPFIYVGQVMRPILGGREEVQNLSYLSKPCSPIYSEASNQSSKALPNTEDLLRPVGSKYTWSVTR